MQTWNPLWSFVEWSEWAIFFNDLLDLMIFFKNEMCCVSNESRSYEITLTVLFLMPVLCSCVLGALLGGDLGNSNGACPSPVRKSSHTVTHPAPFCFPCFSCTSLKREMILELTDRATAEYFMCGNRRSRVRDSEHSRTHEQENTCWLATAEGHSTSCL